MSTTLSSSPPVAAELTSSQKLMVFVLSMTLFGLADILTEVVPEFQLGPIEISVAYFAFVPVVMVALFHPLYAAIGAVVGEMVFGDLLMGDFGGISELEGAIQLGVALYVAGSLVRDPRDNRQVAFAAILAVTIDKAVGGVVDMLKVVVGVEDLDAVDGLPESVFAIEGVAFLTDLVISGIIFGALIAPSLAERLHGRIEPLLGMQPRQPGVPISGKTDFSPAFIGGAVVLFVVSGLFAFAEYADIEFGVWEPEFLEEENIGIGWAYVGMAIAGALAIGALLVGKASSRRDRSEI